VNQLIKSLERKWKRIGILIRFKGWEKEAWSGVSGKDMLIEFIECKSKERVKESS
jgi:hypothetical protein